MNPPWPAPYSLHVGNTFLLGPFQYSPKLNYVAVDISSLISLNVTTTNNVRLKTVTCEATQC